MAKIEQVEVLMVDLVPKVKRVDAIQSFVSQETPIVRITDDDGAVGTGYTYTIGTGGHAVVELLARNLAPQLIGRDPAQIEAIWKSLFFHTHATAVGAITSLALAAIDTALWDLRSRRSGKPLHVEAGGAQASVPLYTPMACGTQRYSATARSNALTSGPRMNAPLSSTRSKAARSPSKSGAFCAWMSSSGIGSSAIMAPVARRRSRSRCSGRRSGRSAGPGRRRAPHRSGRPTRAGAPARRRRGRAGARRA